MSFFAAVFMGLCFGMMVKLMIRSRQAGMRKRRLEEAGRVIGWEEAGKRAGEFSGFLCVDVGYGDEAWAIKGTRETLEFDGENAPVVGVMVSGAPGRRSVEAWCGLNGVKFSWMVVKTNRWG